MRILAMERGQPGAAAEDFRRLARAEAARAWELYQAGLITVEIIPLTPYPGFARLFASSYEPIP